MGADQEGKNEIDPKALAAADLVSIKLDTVDETLWRRINRPHPALALATVLQGVRDFAAGYPGTLISDTMREIIDHAGLINQLRRPSVFEAPAQISVCVVLHDNHAAVRVTLDHLVSQE